MTRSFLLQRKTGSQATRAGNPHMHPCECVCTHMYIYTPVQVILYTVSSPIACLIHVCMFMFSSSILYASYSHVLKLHTACFIRSCSQAPYCMLHTVMFSSSILHAPYGHVLKLHIACPIRSCSQAPYCMPHAVMFSLLIVGVDLYHGGLGSLLIFSDLHVV